MEKIKRRTRDILAALTIQYILGMWVTLFSIPPSEETPEQKAPIYSHIIFGAHGLVGLAILVLSVLIFVRVYKKEKVVKNLALYGLIAVLVSFAGGIGVTVFDGNEMAEYSSFLMSLGFISSYIFYFRLFFYK